MKLIEPKAELLLQQEGIEGIYKQIELCGRTCYKSENNITEHSAEKFVNRMINSNHTAMLEHGTVYLQVPIGLLRTYLSHDLSDYKYNSYSKYKEIFDFSIGPVGIGTAYITTNMRVIIENGWLDDLQYICEPTEHHEKRYTIRFTTDRGVSHELVRHRQFSFAQESSRYCNYSKDKFGKEISCIIPSWSTLIAGNSYDLETAQICDESEGVSSLDKEFLISLCTAEEQYMKLLEIGLIPQQARQVLPTALKTEICMTGFASDWKYFFNLRYYGKTGAPHPDMKLIAEKAKQEFTKRNLLEFK